MRSRQAACASLPPFAYVVIRHALRRLGEDDRMLADYVASVFVHFGLRDRSVRVGETDDQTYDTLASLCKDLDDPDGRRSFLVRTHLGNYALWLSGVFPDHIEHRRWRRGGPDLDYSEEMGRRGFRLAADHRPRRGSRPRHTVRDGGGAIRPPARRPERRERCARVPRPLLRRSIDAPGDERDALAAAQLIIRHMPMRRHGRDSYPTLHLCRSALPDATARRASTTRHRSTAPLR